MPKIPLTIEENVLLAPMTTLRVGGPARYFTNVSDEGQIVQAFELARDRGWPVFVLGGGSNIVVADDGYNGLVIRVNLRGVKPVSESENEVILDVAAGEDWDEFVADCVRRGLGGIECMSGIPGLVGGTPVQNVGAYGQEVANTIVSVRTFDRRSDRFVDLSNAECRFQYRTSIFNTEARGRYVVISVRFRLLKNSGPAILYRDLREYFEGRTPSLTETRDAVLAIRRKKSMVIDENDQNSKSAGSFFKNPIVDRLTFERVAAGSDNVPFFEVDAERVKIPAAWLIENAGFEKGKILGNAGISTNHTLAIINRGNASAAEIISLKNAVQAAVRARFGITLNPEPVFVGFRDL